MADTFLFLSQPGFQRGLVLGVFGAALVAGLALGLRRRMRPAPVAGLAFAAAATLGLYQVEAPSVWLAGGLGALLGGVAIGSLLRLPRVFVPVLAVPGALLLAWPAIPHTPQWARVLVAAVIVLAGSLTADLDRRRAAGGVAVAMVGATVVGVYGTVPDTEEAMVLLGAITPVVLLGFPLAVARLGTMGATAAVGLVAWTVGHGGRGRGSAIVGGIACLALLIAEPLVAAISRRGAPAGLAGASWLLVGHLALVLVASRVVGLRPELATATIGAAITGVVAVVFARATLSQRFDAVQAGDRA